MCKLPLLPTYQVSFSLCILGQVAHHPMKRLVQTGPALNVEEHFLVLIAVSLKPISTGLSFDAIFMTGYIFMPLGWNQMVVNGAQDPATNQAGNPNEVLKTQKPTALWHGNSNSGHFILRNPHSSTTEAGKLSVYVPRLFLSWGNHVTRSTESMTSCFLYEDAMPGPWQPSLRMAVHQELLVSPLSSSLIPRTSEVSQLLPWN